jgi:hypothetical protein
MVLDALAAWLAQDQSRVEARLLQADAQTRLVTLLPSMAQDTGGRASVLGGRVLLRGICPGRVPWCSLPVPCASACSSCRASSPLRRSMTQLRYGSACAAGVTHTCHTYPAQARWRACSGCSTRCSA